MLVMVLHDMDYPHKLNVCATQYTTFEKPLAVEVDGIFLSFVILVIV